MKVCSVCNEIVAAGQGCARSDCPNQAEATVTPKLSSNPKRTARADPVAHTRLGTPSERALNKSRPVLIGIGAAACLGLAVFLVYKFFDTAASPWAYEQIDLEVVPGGGIATDIDYDKQAAIGIEAIYHRSLGPGGAGEAYGGGFSEQSGPLLGELIISQSADCGPLQFLSQVQFYTDMGQPIGGRQETEPRRIQYSSKMTGFRFRMDAHGDYILKISNPSNNECSYFEIKRRLTGTQWAQNDEDAREEIAQAGAITQSSIGWVYTAEGLERRLASADAIRGRLRFVTCKACHTLNPGGRNGIGPNLFDVIGRDIASRNGFTYSTALSEVAGEWDFAKLDRWIAHPGAFASGAKIPCVGLQNAQERADIIAYLNLHGSSVPLPIVTQE